MSSVANALKEVVKKNQANLQKVKDIKEGYDDFINDWERNFLATCEAWLGHSSSNSLSHKQQAILDDLEKKLLERMD